MADHVPVSHIERSAALLRALRAVDLAGAAAGLRAALAGSARALAQARAGGHGLRAPGAPGKPRAPAKPRAPDKPRAPRPRTRVLIHGEYGLAPIALATGARPPRAAVERADAADAADAHRRVPPEYVVGGLGSGTRELVAYGKANPTTVGDISVLSVRTSW